MNYMDPTPKPSSIKVMTGQRSDFLKFKNNRKVKIDFLEKFLP